MPGTPKGLVLLCQQCGTGSPSSGPRQQSRRRQSAPHARTRARPRRFTFGGYAACRMRGVGCNDHTYPRIPQEALRQRTLPRGRSRCRPRKLSELRQGVAGHQSLLRRQGQSGAGNPETAGRARLLFRRGLGASKPMQRLLPAHRPSASPTATQSKKRPKSQRPLRSASRSLPSTAKPRSRRSRALHPAAG